MHAQAQKIKDRWTLAELVAKTLAWDHVSKQDAYNRLSLLMERGMDETYWHNVSRTDARQDCEKIFSLSVVSEASPPPKKRRSTDLSDGRDAIRLAHWFIDKCVSLDVAKRAFEAAHSAIKEFEDADTDTEGK